MVSHLVVSEQDEADIALNEQHLCQDPTLMRNTKTSSASLIKYYGKAAKQFSLTPGHVHFGTLSVGHVAHRLVRLVNLSTELARFTVIRPELPLR